MEARTRTSTSFSRGIGGATSSTRSTSGGPYLSWTTARIRLLSASRVSAAGGSARPAATSDPLDRAPRLAAARSGMGPAPGRNDPAAFREKASSEVRAVEVHAPDRLVHAPQLAQRERGADECGRDSAQLEVDADSLDRVAQDPLVIERQLDLALECADTGTSEACAASVPATTPVTSGSTERYATVTTFIRGSRPGSP